MPRDPDVLILHTVSALFDDTAAGELQSALEARLPEVSLGRAETPRESLNMVSSAEIVLTALPAPDVFDAATDLRWVQALNAGVDMYDIEKFEENDVAFTNASGVAAEPIAEQVVGYLLLFERGIDRGLRQQERGVWERYTGGELNGKTLGIIGLGAIGSRVAAFGAVFGMRVVGTKRDLDTVPDAVDEAWEPDRLHELLARSDYVVVACPLTGETRGLLDETEFGVMKSSGILVNIARGAVVDEGALTTALQQRRIGGAALDVFEQEPLPQKSPLWDLSNVVVTPHMAGYTPLYMERSADIVAENYRLFEDDETDSFINRIV